MLDLLTNLNSLPVVFKFVVLFQCLKQFFFPNCYYRIRSAYLTKNKLLLRNYFLFVVYSATYLVDILHRWWTNEYEYRTTADRGRSKYSE
jgi:hypothetical protein